MGFNYRKEFARFMAEWNKQVEIMRDERVSEEIISEIYDFYYGQFKADRNYALKKYDFTQIDDYETLHNTKIKNQDLVVHQKEFDELFSGLMQTENKSLLKGLHTLSSSELQVVLMFCEKEMDLKQISVSLKKKYDTVQKQFYRAKNKLKKFL